MRLSIHFAVFLYTYAIRVKFKFKWKFEKRKQNLFRNLLQISLKDERII